MSQSIRPDASEGTLNWGVFGTQIIATESVTVAMWYRVDAIGGTSAFDSDVIVNGVYKAPVAIVLATGDLATPITLTELDFVNNVTYSATRAKNDATTQTDSTKTYLISKFSEVTGQISGVFSTTDSQLKEILSQFITVNSIAADGTITVQDINSSTMYFLLSRNDISALASGETEIWEWMPLNVDSLQFDKPLEGVQPFSFNYTLYGAEKPNETRYIIPS